MIKDENISTFKATFFLLLTFSLEWFLFKSFVQREMAWSPFLNGDANWYLGHSYIVFDSIIKEGTVPSAFFNDPAGIMILLVSSLLYLFFGASRLVALSTNFIFYLIWQGLVLYTIRHITKSWLFAFAILGLCLTVSVPFQVNTNYMLNFMEYQREFVVFCLFSVFIALVLFSDTFLKKKWSVWAGLIAGFMVTFRYNVLFHILGIYFIIFMTFFFILFIKRKYAETVAVYRRRTANGILSFFFMGVVCSYPLYRAKNALYNHYVVGKIIGPKKESFIQLYQQGVRDLWQQIVYYPRIILHSGLGSFFIKTAAVIGVLLLFLIIVTKLLRTRPTAAQDVRREPNSLPFNALTFYWFLLICVFAPLLLLTVYPVRSGNVGIPVAAPCIMFICIFFAHLYNRYAVFNKKLFSRVTVSIAVVALALGTLYQMKCYALVSFSSRNRSDYLEVARMYDDIIAISKEGDIERPGISVNFSENYVLGCGEAITAYQYEHAGELFRVNAKLGSDIGKKFEQDEAIGLIRESDFMLLDTSEEPQGLHDTVKRGLISHNLAEYPFSKSMLPLRPIIKKFVEDNFLLKGCYQIFNREVELYVNKNIEFKPIAIRASSQHEQYSADTIMETSSKIWHSESTPTYPQWLEFEYKSPLIINRISILCQIGAPERAPSDFYFQGQYENGQWLNLLKVNSAPFKAGNESISWSIENTHAFKRYRLYITKNNGAADLLTIGQISFGYANNKDM